MLLKVNRKLTDVKLPYVHSKAGSAGGSHLVSGKQLFLLSYLSLDVAVRSVTVVIQYMSMVTVIVVTF